MKKVVNWVVVITACVLWGQALCETAIGQKPELVVQIGHPTGVTAVAFSPDGKLLASGSSDGTVRLWDVAGGTQFRAIASHSETIISVAFSPDGRLLASGSLHATRLNGTVELWDVARGTQLRSIEKSSSAAFSPDGEVLATTSEDGTVKLWEVASWSQIRSLEGQSSPVISVAFSPDGKLLAGASPGSSIKLWEVASGATIRSLEISALTSVAFSPDGKLLASVSSDDGTIKIWDVTNWSQIRSLKGRSGRIQSVTFSPDGKSLAGAFRSDTISSEVKESIELWELANGTPIRKLGGQLTPYLFGHPVAFSLDGKSLASGSFDGTIKLWDVASGTQIGSLAGYPNLIDSVAFSADGKSLASVGIDNSIKLWDVASGTQTRSLEKFSATRYSQSEMRQLEETLKVLSPVFGGGLQITNSVTFSPDGKLLANASPDGTIKLLDVVGGTQIRSMAVAPSLLNSVAFSPDGKLLAGVSMGDTIKLWDVASGAQIRSFGGPPALFLSIAFSPDGKVLASPDRKTIKLWDVASGTQIGSLNVKSGPTSVAFSPDGKLLVSGAPDNFLPFGTYDNAIELWDLASGTKIRSLKGQSPSQSTSVAFSPDGKLIVNWGAENSIKLWDVASGTQIRLLEGHSSSVKSVAFSPDGRYLLSGSRDGTVKLWSVSDGQMLATLISLDQNDWLVVTPDYLFDGSITAWRQSNWRFKNNTFDLAPVEAFFSEFYYPGLLTDILSGKKPKAKARLEEKDIRQPQITVLLAGGRTLPNSGMTTPTVRIQVEVTEAPADQKRSLPRGGVQDLRLFRNGSLVKVWRGDAFTLGPRNGCHQPRSGEVICTAEVPITAGENRFTAYAFNRDNVKSSDGELSVKGSEKLKRGGTLYILAIGIDKYANPNYNLKYAIADAQELSHELKKQQDKLNLYAHTEVIALVNQEATKQNILLAFRRLASGNRVNLPDSALPSIRRIKPSRPEDAVVIYFAGHGTANQDSFYLIPHDLGITNRLSSLNKQSLKTLHAHSISDLELESALEQVDAGQLLMVIDACNSGQALEAEEKRRGPMNSKGLAQLAYEKGMYILTAAQSYQAALEVSRYGHGLLTYALLEGLKELKADKDRNREVWEREWMDYAAERVPQMQVEEMKQRGSKRVFAIEGNQAVLQRPRVFYRREVAPRPFVIVRP